MKSVLTIIAAAAIAFVVSGCAKQAPASKPALKLMNAKELAKEFKKGSKVCSWKAGKKGKDRGKGRKGRKGRKKGKDRGKGNKSS